MKTHTRACKAQEQPCKQEHTYFCKFCGTEFLADEETHWYEEESGVTFPTRLWPYCSHECAADDGYPIPLLEDPEVVNDDTILE